MIIQRKFMTILFGPCSIDTFAMWFAGLKGAEPVIPPWRMLRDETDFICGN